MGISSPIDERVDSISTNLLTPIVRSRLARDDATIDKWTIRDMVGGWGGAVGGTALYRLQGVTTDGQPWALILKILYERPGEPESAPVYWKREFELYRSGIVTQLPVVAVRSPKIYALEECADACWIWLEDLDEDPRLWSIADYGVAAHYLGRLNGAYLTGAAIPQAAWLNDNFHCRQTGALTETFARLAEPLANPLLQRALPLHERANILAIWRDVPRICLALAALPPTFCHFDAFRRNLFLRDNELILIDWALAGRGVIGEELVALVAISLYFPEISPARATEVDATVFDGYMSGLREAGWQGPRQQARLGYLCGMVLRGLAGVAQDMRLLAEPANHALLLSEHNDRNIEQVADFFAEIRQFRLIAMAQELRRLLTDSQPRTMR